MATGGESVALGAASPLERIEFADGSNGSGAPLGAHVALRLQAARKARACVASAASPTAALRRKRSLSLTSPSPGTSRWES